MMEHKAFVFDYREFDKNLRWILEESLATGNLASLKSFIIGNVNDLRDLYEGEPLDENWESLIEISDAHQYGDFALTMYYDPQKDIGLGCEWEALQELVIQDGAITSPILGRTVGPSSNLFDPGKMGSYFQDANEVLQSYNTMIEMSKSHGQDICAVATNMLQVAIRSKQGLYVTF